MSQTRRNFAECNQIEMTRSIDLCDFSILLKAKFEHPSLTIIVFSRTEKQLRRNEARIMAGIIYVVDLKNLGTHTKKFRNHFSTFTFWTLKLTFGLFD